MNVTESIGFINEPEARRKWLISLLVLSGISYFFSLVIFLIEGGWLDLSKEIFRATFFLCVSYYFIFKKRGWKLLILHIIVIPFQIVSLSLMLYLTQSEEILIQWILGVPLFTYYLINCNRLRKYNNEMAALKHDS